MKRKFLRSIIIFIFLFLVMETTYGTENEKIESESEKATQEFAYFTLKKMMLHSLDKTINREYEAAIIDPSGLIVLLADLDNDDARSLLLQILEVYVGSATGEALSYAIVKQGKKIKNDLEVLLNQPVRCDFLKNNTYKAGNLRCLSKETRDRNIRRLLNLIERGKRIEYVL